MVSRSSSPRRTLSSSAAHSTRSSRDCGNSRPFGSAADGVAGATNTLQKARDRTWRAKLTDQIHIADVDTELQRRGRHQRFEFAALQALLRVQALFLRQASVMRGDRRLAQAIRQLARHALGHASRVDEHQRGAVRLDQLHQLVIDLLPHVGATLPLPAATVALQAANRVGVDGRYRQW